MSAPTPSDLPEFVAGFPELHRAAILGDHETLRSCLARGDGDALSAGVSCPHPLGGVGIEDASPLFLAAGSTWGATEETVRLLLQAGAEQGLDPGGPRVIAAAVWGWPGCFTPGDDARLAVLLSAGVAPPQDEESVARIVSHAAAANSDCLHELLEAGLSPNPIVDIAGYNARSDEQMRATLRELRDSDEEEITDILGAAAPGASTPEESPFSLATKPGPPLFLCPLHSAAAAGNAESVELLLAFGANLRAVDREGRLAISLATSNECIDAMVAVDPSFETAEDVNSLLEGLDDVAQGWMSEDEAERVRELVRARVRCGVQLLTPDHDGDVLEYYAFQKNLPAVELLLELGVPVAKSGRTALHALAWHYEGAADDEHVDFAKFTRTLLDAGVPVDAPNEQGNTPLHRAVAGDGANPSVIGELLRAGANPNARNADGQTPLVHLYETSFGYDDETLVQTLLEAGANPNLRDRHGQSAVDVARSRSEGREPKWREEQWKDKGLPCGWKGVADPESGEARSLRRIERAAASMPKDNKQ